MKSISVLLFPLLLWFVPVLAQSQDTLKPEEVATAEVTRHAHLVGHEEAELMARIEEALKEWDPRHLKSPYLKEVETFRMVKKKNNEGEEEWVKVPVTRYALRRPDLSEFIADPDAAVALGKAFFWDMQTGSDFTGKENHIETPYGTACASCHYRFGIDVRDRNTNAIAFQAWDEFVDHYGLQEGGKPPFDQRDESFEPNQRIDHDPDDWDRNKLERSHDIVGSQGVVRKFFEKAMAAKAGAAQPETSKDYTPAPDRLERVEMFKIGETRVRQVTHRNSPTTINATFNDRQFHDGRAESTFNGFSIFGDFDKNTILVKANLNDSGNVTGFTPAKVSIPLASLASQAVGPVVNEVEMSYQGRTFHDLAIKLLDAEPLAAQTIAGEDSVFEPILADWDSAKLELNYRNLIQKAFRREWWAVEENGELPPAGILFRLLDFKIQPKRDRTAFYEEVKTATEDHLLINNFSLFWGLSIMLYESTLISNDSPFDHMLRGDGSSVEALFEKMSKDATQPISVSALGKLRHRPDEDDKIGKIRLDRIDRTPPVDNPDHLPPVLNGTAMFQRGLRVFTRNCAECHEPPTFTTAAEVELGPEPPEPIAEIHAHSLVRIALADAFKERLLSAGETVVHDTNRELLGGRNYFFDEERLPELEAIVGPLLIENMEIPATEPKSFNDSPVRVPMITWQGTRPDLEFAPSRGPGADPVAPYAFYDLGYYNIGTSEPRYDWGVWATDEIETITFRQIIESFDSGDQQRVRDLLTQEAPISSGDVEKLNPVIQSLADLTDEELSQRLEFLRSPNIRMAAEEVPESARQFVLPDNGLNDLGSAYRLNRAMAAEDQPIGEIPGTPTDHSEERDFLDPKPRKDNHFFKRARRMVMTSETWGHRKPFITDNELMGWGAFKTPTLRNVALTEPYMHNGRFLDLRQILSFYSSDSMELIPAEKVKNPGLHPEMGRLDLNEDGQDNDVNGKPDGDIDLIEVHDAEALLFFLHCLTDERVALEKAPFDHPSLVIPNGYDNQKRERIHAIDAVGRNGVDAPTSPPSQFPEG